MPVIAICNKDNVAMGSTSRNGLEDCTIVAAESAFDNSSNLLYYRSGVLGSVKRRQPCRLWSNNTDAWHRACAIVVQREPRES